MLTRIAVAAGLLAALLVPSLGAPQTGAMAVSRVPAPIVVTEQGRDQVMVFDRGVDSWTDVDPRWTWRPTAEQGFGDFLDNWGLVDEAKLRQRGNQRYLLTTDSYGLAAVVPYPSGAGSYWAADVGRPNNPHSIELLPDGNVAVAASTGGWLRVYTASQGSRSTTYVEYPLAGAHGALWDPANRLLWTVGDTSLVALTVGGTPSAPTLTEARVAALPTSWGHDLSPVYGDPDRLWLSTGSQVYQFVKSTGEFGQDFPAAQAISQVGVKAVTNDPVTGRVLTTLPDSDNPCSWCTDTVNLYKPSGSRVLPDGQLYKARWFIARYQ